MKFFLVAALLTGAIAVPTELSQRADDPVCSGQLPVPVCCKSDAFGFACINGTAPSEEPRDGHKFTKLCEETGSQPRCCATQAPGPKDICMQPAPKTLSDFKDGFKDKLKGQGDFKDSLLGGSKKEEKDKEEDKDDDDDDEDDDKEEEDDD